MKKSRLSHYGLGVITFMVLSLSGWAQQRKIKGVVLDAENNAPLVGATVSLKNNSRSNTVTNSQGNFEITVSSGEVELQATYVGYGTNSVKVTANETSVRISLSQSVSNLNDVVVVGYGTKPLAQISSSIDVVSGAKLNDVTSNDITSLLQGKSAGIIVSNSNAGDPNSTPSIVIRGSGSISAKSGPLYVVDGIIGGSANPNDVESVTILKDAAATGLYGSRAANGVIIITTKSGRAGETKIRLTSTVGFNKASFGNFRVMNSQELYDYEKTFFPPDVMASSRPDSLLKNNTNWKDLAFRTGLTQNYNLTLSGGTEKSQYYVSGNYYKEQGSLKYTGNEEYAVRTKVAYNISPKLKLNVNINAAFRKYENEASGHYGALEGATNNMPFDNPFEPDGTIRMGTEAGWIGREHDNFLQGWLYNYNKTRRASVNGDLDLTYKVTKDLTLSTYNRASFNNSKNGLFMDVRSKYGAGTSGELDNEYHTNSSLITSNRVQYKKTLGEHEIGVLGVAEAEKNYTDQNITIGQGLPPGLSVMDVASIINSAKGNTGENSFSKGLVQFDYNYGRRYFFVGSFINESSSVFGADNRSANFYTLAGSWILTNENFMKNQKLFDQLKLRLSYGSTGNAQIDNYQSLGLYSYSSQYAGFSASSPFQLANKSLTWEKAKTTNLGVDIGLFKRISVSVDAYEKTTQGLLLEVPLPYESGYSSVIQNVGSVRNRGVEISLHTDNLTGAFKWRTDFNIAFNKNEVLKLYQGKDIITDNQNISVGHDLFSWYMRKWAGVDPENGDPLWEKVATDANNQKVITTTNSYNDASLQFVGTGSPDFTGGMNNEFTYKGFSLNVFFNFVSGNRIFNSSAGSFNSDGAYIDYNNMVLADGWSRWMKPGDVATEPKSVYGGNQLSNKPSSRYLEDGSYIRLRNIRLGYELLTSILGAAKIKSVKLFVSGDNLWIGTRYSGMDPEVSLIPGLGALDRTNLPINKKILFGINVEF